jgi:hypothetical protein
MAAIEFESDGVGCYLVFSGVGATRRALTLLADAFQGSLLAQWSQTPVEGAYAFFQARKKVPKFKVRRLIRLGC